MSEFWSSISAWYKERTTSSLYGTYIVSFVLWNWKIVYTYLLQPDGVIQIPIAEYSHQKLMLFSGDVGYIKYFLNDLWILVPPMFFTFVIIKFIPKINNLTYELNTKNLYERKHIEDREKLAYERLTNKNLQSLVEVKQEQAKSKSEIQKNTSEEDRWNAEYENFMKNSTMSVKFRQILDTVYNNNGIVENYGERNADPEIITYSHINELIEFNENSRNQIELTKKGKFFAKKILDEN